MEIDIKNIKAAYETATESEKTLLSTLFPDLPLGQIEEEVPVTERIKTFEDAVFALGDHPFVTEWRMGVDLSPDLEAYLQLRVICAALNEGWKPKFDEDECRYYPWFCLYPKEEYEELGEDKKKYSRAVFRSNGYARTIGGVSYAEATYDSVTESTCCGYHIVLKTEELAEYCGKQFIDIWVAYLLNLPTSEQQRN